MKKIMLLLLIAFSFYITNVSAISNEDVYAECVYDDGSTVIFDKGEVYYSYVGNQQNSSSVMSSSINLLLSNGKGLIVNNKVQCPDTIKKYNTEIEHNKLSFYYFKEETLTSKEIKESLEEVYSDVSIFESFIIKFLKIVTPSRQYKLVLEDIALEDNDMVNEVCEYVVSKKQILGENKYLSILKLNTNQLLAEGSNYTTSLNNNSIFDDGCPKEIYANEPIYYININHSQITTKYGDARYDISETNDKNHQYKFELVENIYDGKDKDDGINVCEQIPNTVVVIKQIIKIMQIVIPIIIVVLTMMDYLKVISTPSAVLNEEDGSTKFSNNSKATNKKFIRRLIFAVIFVFLPTIVNVILHLLYNNGIIEVSNINCFLM